MKTQMKQGFTLIELLVVIVIIALLASISMPALTKAQEKGRITVAVANCRSVIQAVKFYAADEGGRYPDQDPAHEATTANSAFRNLFIAGAIDKEGIFGCDTSPYRADGNIGVAPEYDKAVEAGECHWMFTAGLNDTSPSGIPVVYENATSTGNDPTWNADAAGRSVRGRTWSGGRVIVGLNDNSVDVLRCEATKGSNVRLRPLGQEGKNIFTQYSDAEGAGEFKILDVEEKP
ncbi:MAG: type II secretion system protein [Roseimicrobium sp.]